ncbi:MAG: hypothetical protein K6A67_01960 [Bacteroidales bacterium]|nr:hypothetical protein [Bacteroidales bacterium]
MADEEMFYERVKKKDIYSRWFQPGVKMKESEFRKAVQNAYDEIIILIPELNGGRQQQRGLLHGGTVE